VSAETWGQRCAAKQVEADALEAVNRAKCVLRAREAEYHAAVDRHTQAVADDISEARGYPCDSLGNRIEGAT
jgi:hypothetical protein